MNCWKRYVLVLPIFAFGFTLSGQEVEKETTQFADSINDIIQEIWNESDLSETMSFELFDMAMQGYHQINSFKRGLISIIDYSKPSTEKRFYVIDLNNKTLLFHTLISHGKNTGLNIPIHFSNKINSLKSSLGFFRTAETYVGKHGYSLRLDGLEKGFNDNARKRSIVIHSAIYVSKNFIKNQGRLGRSWGCPALPVLKSKKIINRISNGTCLFIYGNNEDYLNTSEYIKR